MKLTSRLITICLLCVLLSACGFPMGVSLASSLPTLESIHSTAPSPTRTKIPSPTSTITITPTSTPVPTPTSTPTPVDPWEAFPGPSEDSEMEIPRPVTPIDLSPKVVNIILLGSDRRPDRGYYQTDALMIVSLDPKAGTATFVSVPRDLYVYIPGWKVNRINTAEYHGGFEMIANTVMYNMGIPLHHWVRVEYQGFSEAVDILGGIDIRPAYHIKDMCEGVSYEYKPDVVYHMDGFAAMCYARMRMQSSDFDRLRRQQEVMLALFNKFISMNGLLKVPQLYDTFTSIMETDMTLDEILPLIPLATKLALDPSRIQFYRIDYSMVENWRTPKNGYAVLLPNRELIQEMLEQALGGQ